MTWQPIDSAPKDGTEILASDYDVIEIVSWTVYSGGADWWSRWGDVMFPAWWQPLPEHPPLPGEDSAPVKPFKGGVLVPAEILQPSPPRPGPFGWLLDEILGHRLPYYVPNPHPNAGKLVTTNEDGTVIVIPLPLPAGEVQP
jgi:hypothetical protein